MTYKIEKTLVGMALVFIVALSCLLLWNAHMASGAITSENATSVNLYRTYQFFSSSTAPTVIATSTVGQATSTSIVAQLDSQGRIDNGSLVIAGAKKVEIVFAHGGVSHPNTGSATYQIQAQIGDGNWFTVNKLVQSTSTNIANAGEVSTWQLLGTSTVPLSMDLTNDNYYAIRCIVVLTTDGEAGCAAFVTW